MLQTCTNGKEPMASPAAMDQLGCDWMSGPVGDLTLQTIALPGTHDSAAYMLAPNLEPTWPAWLLGLVRQQGRLVDWRLCHSSGAADQLRRGIRQFDLRVGWCEEAKQLYFAHSGQFAVPAMQFLEDVALFLQRHDSEFVVLCMQRSKGYQNGGTGDRLITETMKRIGLLLPTEPALLDQSISSITLQGRRAMIVVDRDMYQDLSDNSKGLVWEHRTLVPTDYWIDTSTLSVKRRKSVEIIDSALKTEQLKPDDPQLCWISNTATPQAADIVMGMLISVPTTLRELTEPFNQDLPGWLMALTEQRRRRINAVMMDWPTDADILAVVALNRERRRVQPPRPDMSMTCPPLL